MDFIALQQLSIVLMMFYMMLPELIIYQNKLPNVYKKAAIHLLGDLQMIAGKLVDQRAPWKKSSLPVIANEGFFR